MDGLTKQINFCHWILTFSIFLSKIFREVRRSCSKLFLKSLLSSCKVLNCSSGLNNYMKVNEVFVWLLTPKLIEMQKWDRILLQTKLLECIKLSCVLNNCLFREVYSRCSMKMIAIYISVIYT